MIRLNNRIEIQNISFSFDKDTKIINDVSLSIEKGEFLSILGASGSGKSTLLRILSNILPADKTHILEGKISIFGKTPREYIDTGKLSFMFQEASLMPNLNVKDNITFPLKLRGEIIESDFINELLNIVGLTEHQYKYPSELSGGMKTRVSLARAFVTRPEILLLDEPFSSLDISWKYELYMYLKDISKKYKTTVILVTHDIEESIILGNSVYNIESKNMVEIDRTGIDLPTFENISRIIDKNGTNSLKLKRDLLLNSRNGNMEEVLHELHKNFGEL